jgi:hypothetical protein
MIQQRISIAAKLQENTTPLVTVLIISNILEKWLTIPEDELMVRP